MKILITGASGFIGSFIVEESLRQGFETWAAVRPTSSKRYLTDSRIHFINLNLSSEDDLVKSLQGMTFDYVVHAAGITKSAHKEAFFSVNVGGTRNLVQALLRLQMPLKRFIYLSSLSIFGAIREDLPYQEITESDTPQPNTAYGVSKLEAEQLLESVKDRLPYVILRPTGVYGPREKDYYMLAKSIRNHFDFAVGFKRQDITFVYVKDVVQAVFLALDHGKNHRKYFLSDGQVYQSSTFSDLLRENLGHPWWIRITAPLWLLKIITTVCGCYGQLTGTMTALNNDKYNILKQRNWRCDIRPAVDELGYEPHYDLQCGVKEAVRWYKENKWL